MAGTAPTWDGGEWGGASTGAEEWGATDGTTAAPTSGWD